MNNTNTQDDYRISAVIPAYNNAQYIARSIQSALGQTYPVNEIIVVDDGSTDNTAEVIAGYKDRVTLIRQENAGASTARNTGIERASGNWIAFLDGDDEWLPEHLERQFKLLQRNQDIVWSSANFRTCLCDKNQQSACVSVDKARRYLKGNDFVSDYFLAYPAGLRGHTDTMVIRKDILVETGLFRVGQKKANDLDMWWRIAFCYPRMGFVPEPMAVYHLSIPSSISKKITSWGHYADLIQRHQQFARQFNRQDVFDPFAAILLKGWMRSMLFHSQKQDIRKLLKIFRQLFSQWYYYVMWLLTVFPKLTACGCFTVSIIVRLLRLRRRIVLPPSQKE